MTETPIVHNRQNKRFEIREEDAASLEYREAGDLIALMHTIVPESMGGKGLATRLAKHTLDWIDNEGKKAKVYCPFVAAFLKRHPEYNRLVAEA